MLVLLDIHTKRQRYIHSCSGGGIGAIMPHPSREYFAMAEKGKKPDIIIYKYPSLQPYRNLQGGTAKAYSCVNFNHDGTLLASVGGAPDYMLTLWDWNQEQVVLRCKAFSQDIYRVTFSPDNPGQLTTSGSGHIKSELTHVYTFTPLFILVEIGRKDGRTCHSAPIQQFVLDEGELITVGADGAIRCWATSKTIDSADCADDSGLFEMQPMNELIIGRNVSLSSMVRSTIPDSTLWFAQDSNGGIWKLDLSFSNITYEPIGFAAVPGPVRCMQWAPQSHGGYDAGYLYHCTFSDQQSTDLTDRNDEPFAYVPIQDADDNPILTVCFCEAKQLLLCGMQDGSIRAYPLESEELQPEHMEAYWALGVHDGQYGSLRQLRVSHDDRFVLSTGADGNIFSFRLLEKEEMDEALQRGHAKQKLELDRMIREAELRKQERRKKLAELRKRFEALLQQNQSLPAHIRLQPSELELDRCFRDEIERQTAEKVKEARRELAWETEKYRIGLRKLQERFSDSVVCDTVTVSAIRSDHKVSTYRLLVLPNKLIQQKEQEVVCQLSAPASQEQGGFREQKDAQAEAAKQALPATATLQRAPQGAGGKIAARQAEKLRKAAEKAEKARAKIEQRKKQWDEFYASKPTEDFEDPEDICAIQLARENMGDFKLKTAKDFKVPEHLRMNTEKKTAQVVQLEEQMEEGVLAFDAKLRLLSHEKSKLDVEMKLADLQHASLGDNNKFANFLTKVFKKKIKRVKKKEKTDNADEGEESEEESDEESDWDSDEDDEEMEGGGGFDDSVCPPNCNPELFENVLSLREHRLDLEELQYEEKTIADNLKKEFDSLSKKVKRFF
ncbi:Cilia- and flagella-associated protein 44 [Bagarius yarrelli]|uniref:Cilia-and flagella-associated protein 44 n=1 Tax=Bagarius yarrelli TaxID=175774 RepID=A0A556TWK6_BAGYA|nr:Cilia- and flagella-associated protein 44 [Bagarius yarrelli]